MSSDKDRRRNVRDQVIKDLCQLADQMGVNKPKVRPSSDEMNELVENLAGAVPEDQIGNLKNLVQRWMDHGGSSVDLAKFEPGVEELAPAADSDALVPSHTTQAWSAAGYRLGSKAFMLTFNCLAFVASVELWVEFHAWVEDRSKQYGSKYWSATMEESGHSSEGRVHFHCYLSWHGSNGVDHRTLDAWKFRGVAPRVDKNTDQRGPFYWTKATQHGHFYVSVKKKGTLHVATNYAPFTGLWVPDAQWIVALWRGHKLDHDDYMQLSVMMRDGHDRRRACVLAVVASEKKFEYAAEMKKARELISRSALPFKPLPDKIQKWRMQYDEPLERYEMLVLWGPSRTGKSRLARHLFGDDQTLVVDVQHAQHPDLHLPPQPCLLGPVSWERADPR